MLAVIRRNTERFHTFADDVARTCGIHDLQGLLMNDDWSPTAAIEAFELKPLEARLWAGLESPYDLLLLDHSIYGIIPEDTLTYYNGIPYGIIPYDKLYYKCVIAERVGVPLYLLTHIQGQHGVTIYEVQADHGQRTPNCVCVEEKSEEGFVAWWRERKQTVQTKAYRQDLSRRIANSYFDWVLEAQGEKWGGNIDGFLIDRSSDYPDIIGIVENRFTNKAPLSSYDPNRYFRYGGGDYYTWLPLFNLHQQLGVPLFLMTYSNRQGETHRAGLTIVESLGQNGITYVRDRFGRQICPCQNITSSVLNIARWFQDIT